jgi:hypothetical protein
MYTANGSEHSRGDDWDISFGFLGTCDCIDIVLEPGVDRPKAPMNLRTVVTPRHHEARRAEKLLEFLVLDHVSVLADQKKRWKY